MSVDKISMNMSGLKNMITQKISKEKIFAEIVKYQKIC
jgi:hypothetical protein